MNARRKNAKRLKRLRQLGIPITGEYLVANVLLERLGIAQACTFVDRERVGVVFLAPPGILTAAADVGYVPVWLQRSLLAGLSDQAAVA